MPKKIIDGLLYDTEKATLIWQDDKSRQRRLYFKTDNGHYFCLYGTSKINPMSEDSIKELLGEKAVDVYLELFPTPEEA